MAVIMAPRRESIYGGLNIGGLLTSLLGSQLGAMFERSAKAKQVEAERGIMSSMGDTSQMNQEQMMSAMLNHPNAGKASEGFMKNFDALAKAANINRGIEGYTEGMLGSGFGAPQVKAITNSSRFQETPMQLAGIERLIPKLIENSVDAGDSHQLYQTNPYVPGIVEGTERSIGKSLSPDKAQEGVLTREGFTNAKEIAAGRNATSRYVADVGASSRSGGGTGDRYDNAHFKLQRVEQIDKILKRLVDNDSPEANGMAQILQAEKAQLILESVSPGLVQNTAGAVSEPSAQKEARPEFDFNGTVAMLIKTKGMSDVEARQVATQMQAQDAFKNR